jgi:putative IMPACT (imprinted ancient) family translation regulator
VLRRQGVTNAVCVVTRYFGGVLLGTGGLLRAYTKSTADALEAAGVSAVRRWVETELPCSYAQMEKLKLEAAAAGGIVEDVEYGAGVTLRVLVPEEQSEAFAGRIFDQSAGAVKVRVTGESFRAVPLSGGVRE